MSFQQFIATVEADIKADVAWVEKETVSALTYIWDIAKPVFIAAEPTIIRDGLTALIAFLGKAGPDVLGNDFAGIEQAFMEELKAAGSTLFNDLEALGSTLIQVLIGLAKGQLAKS